MSAPATGLTRIGGIDFDQRSASFFRFARELTKEGRPRGVCNAFRQTMVMNHPIHREVFDANDPIGVDDLTALLMGKILSSPSDAFMHTGYCFAMLASSSGAFRQFGMFALYLRQRLLFLTEKPGVLNLRAIRECCKGRKSDVNTHLCRGFWQVFWFHLTGKRDVPLACRGTTNGSSLDLSTDGTMIDQLDAANLGKAHPVVMGKGETRLSVGETVIVPFAFKAGITWVFTCLAATEERLERQFHPFGDIVYDTFR